MTAQEIKFRGNRTESATSRQAVVVAFILVNSDGCGVFETYWANVVCGCGGPIRTEYTIFEHTLPQRTDPFRRASLRTKRLHAWFRLAGNPGASPQDSDKHVYRD
jgi:hypothetical protein